MADEVGEVGKRKVGKGKDKVAKVAKVAEDVATVAEDVAIVDEPNHAENQRLRDLIAHLIKDINFGNSIAGHNERLNENDPRNLRSGPPDFQLWVQMSLLETELKSQDLKARAALKSSRK